ncbi:MULTISPECIES: DUF4326 domain-containing protein [Pseudomonas]|uniref:DUF4326 domain-containing protein n=1 Tax=Pseudomonas TaxID=286 RepID=UPI000694B138|nr:MULTISPECIES: DUF4326 domain-containing protein [Pseudomonas]AZD91064.1 hypothetical protein C4K13_1632 [Pseudomonas chlororaphis subsp. aureofaciens]KAB0530127.1 DUF4326 domain-containing protein [Pseudomonas chlororaphis subsp. aureofaciens]TSD31434.1 DUF4326 domain-containing protein [Pseudomonas sp. ATCC 13985]WDG62059.1 DUF4326 domain-containing protein [Pseudomonas chlororaphis]WDG68269.1 DUF4326 domain-containing protein [Pseudomonas chlororaphis]
MSTDAKVLIAYPGDFLSYQKFERKVAKIIGSLEKVELICMSDENGFIERFATENDLKLKVYALEVELVQNATHAVLFQDEERNCFFALFNELLDREIPIRKVNLKITKVSNKDLGESYDVYIGRGTLWGNPYQMGKEGTRDEVIEKFSYDFEKRFLKFSEKFDENIEKLRGKTLGCHCKPAPCHGDIIAKYLNSQDDGE